MNADKNETLKYDDFKNSKTILEERIEERGHLCYFFLNFHCELNAIERCWYHAKKHCRAYANDLIVRLRKIVPEGLDTCTTELIRKFFVKSRDYLKAYANGCTCGYVDALVKSYKSHRRISNVHQ